MKKVIIKMQMEYSGATQVQKGQNTQSAKRARNKQQKKQE